MPQVRALSPRPNKERINRKVGSFFIPYITGLEPEKVCSVKKQSCGLFLAKSVKSGTEGVALGRQAESMRSRRSSPVTSTIPSVHNGFELWTLDFILSVK